MILALDTSTDQGSVALLDFDVPRTELSWFTRGNHSRHLTQVVRHLFHLEHLSVSALTGIVVASGPGSFSGLRVGISEGKGLAMALDIPLVGISTLDVIAYQASCCSDDVWALLPAGRGRFYLAHYRGTAQDWRRVSDFALVTLEEAAQVTAWGGLLAGAGAEPVALALRAAGIVARVEPPPWRLRRAGFLAELGRRYLEAGGTSQLETLQPLYLRRSAAEEKRAAESQE